MRLTSNILTGMDVCLDSAPAGSVFSSLTGETETCKPYLGHFCQVYFCTRVNEKRKKYILCHPTAAYKCCTAYSSFACMLSHFSHVRLFATLWTVARQASLSMGFSRQEYWSGLPYPPPGDLPNAGIEPVSLTSRALAGRFFTTGATWEASGSF